MSSVMQTISIPGLVLALTATMGCQRSEPVQWQPSSQVTGLAEKLGESLEPAAVAELQKTVSTVVQEHSGTFLKPKVLSEGQPDFKRELELKLGQEVYTKRCVQCHGVNGDGNGPVAASLYPRPRDYTKGIFKFTSTPYGGKPRRGDLMATLYRGVVGTSMPNFRLLPKKELEAVVDYVIVLAQRGELEMQLANEAESSEELDPEYVPEFVTDVGTRWKEAQSSLTQPLTPEPELTMERVAAGREAFLSKGCNKCHGDDGRGHTRDNIGKDSWGFSTRAADLTSGMLHGGQEPIDIYRRIMNGINGTPMPGFRSALESEPETIWNLVAYVIDVSNRRRQLVNIPAGLMKPYNEPAPSPADAAPAAE
jgi:mono/diheme cytochrome c family protein